MKIALVNRWYPPHGGHGGIAAYNQALARQLSRRGHEVTVLAARISRNMPRQEKDGSVNILRLSISPPTLLSKIPWIKSHSRSLSLLAYSLRVATALRASGPYDLVEFAEIDAEGFCYLHWPGHSPSIIRCHTPTAVLKSYYRDTEAPYSTRITEWLERSCARRADAITAPSRDMSRLASEVFGVDSDRIRIIPNPIESPTRISRETRGRETRILYVGRLERAKGLAWLIAAFALLLRRKIPACLYIVGEDRLGGKGWRSHLEDWVRRENIGHAVRFLGPVDEQTLADCYARSDVAVVPSLLYESFSYTCAQAMSWGLPVVASRIGGIPETIEDGNSGILVEPGNTRQLTEVLAELCLDEDRRRRMGEAGRHLCLEKFTPDIVVRQFEDVALRITGRS